MGPDRSPGLQAQDLCLNRREGGSSRVTRRQVHLSMKPTGDTGMKDAGGARSPGLSNSRLPPGPCGYLCGSSPLSFRLFVLGLLSLAVSGALTGRGSGPLEGRRRGESCLRADQPQLPSRKFYPEELICMTALHRQESKAQRGPGLRQDRIQNLPPSVLQVASHRRAEQPPDGT